MAELLLSDDRLFPAEPSLRAVAREIYNHIRALPIYSPHGHTNPQWFADNVLPTDPVELLIVPDHYIFRMLYSQGIRLEELGIAAIDGSAQSRDGIDYRSIWRLFAQIYHLFRGTPVKVWLDHTFAEVFGIRERLCAATADASYDCIAAAMQSDAFRPAALLARFNIKLLATTESPLDPLVHHQKIMQRGLPCKIVTTFRPDCVIDPEFNGFAQNVRFLGTISDIDTASFEGYLAALTARRVFFKTMGATASDHSAISALTCDLTRGEAQELFQKVTTSSFSAEEAAAFRGMMLLEMARMSREDGLVMQLHCGSLRNHNRDVHKRFGADK